MRIIIKIELTFQHTNTLNVNIKNKTTQKFKIWSFFQKI